MRVTGSCQECNNIIVTSPASASLSRVTDTGCLRNTWPSPSKAGTMRGKEKSIITSSLVMPVIIKEKYITHSVSDQRKQTVFVIFIICLKNALLLVRPSDCTLLRTKLDRDGFRKKVSFHLTINDFYFRDWRNCKKLDLCQTYFHLSISDIGIWFRTIQ